MWNHFYSTPGTATRNAKLVYAFLVSNLAFLLVHAAPQLVSNEFRLWSPSAAIPRVSFRFAISQMADSFASKVIRRSVRPNATEWSTSGFAIAARPQGPCV
jgi:hypothetical protein